MCMEIGSRCACAVVHCRAAVATSAVVAAQLWMQIVGSSSRAARHAASQKGMLARCRQQRLADRSAGSPSLADVSCAGWYLQVIGNTGSNSTGEALHATEQGFAVGMDAALQINPYYGKTSKLGLMAHFDAGRAVHTRSM